MKKPVLDNLKEIKGFKTSKIFWLALVVIIFILAALPSYYFYSQYKKTQALLQNPTQAATLESQKLIDEIGTLIELPRDQNPTIATVSDITKLSEQPFFANAKNGDKVLIYTQAKKAILYRPSENKIIEVAPVNLGSSSSASLSTPTPDLVSVSIYNGTATSGLAATAENKITASMSVAKVLNKADAKGSYTKTEVIDVSGNQSMAASQIASLLGGTVVASIPDGEIKPNSDILVILGSDFGK